MSSLRDICIVFDFDGFHVSGKFYPREVGFCSLTAPRRNGSYRFRLDSLVPLMTEQDWKTARVCTKYIHGMSFRRRPRERGLFELDDLYRLVLDAYRESSVRGGRKIIAAYKGGRVERDLLERLDIPCVNLEDFGCPKFEKLVHYLPARARDCGHHFGLKNPSAVVHCPRLETLAFAEWVNTNVFENQRS